VFLVNSRLGHLSAAFFGSICERYHLIKASLLPKLRNKFAEFLSPGSLEHLRILSLPTCVGLRYGRLFDSLEAFLGSMIRICWLARRRASPSSLRLKLIRIFLNQHPTKLDRHIQQSADLSLLRHPIVQTPNKRFRNINLISIAYAFRPQLRIRLTLGGLTFPRKP